jgi:hypothetical protein
MHESGPARTWLNAWPALVLTLLGVVAIAGGALTGEFAETAAKGSSLCLACIGIR